MEKKSNNSYAYIAIVAIVAIVAVIMLVSTDGVTKVVPAQDSYVAGADNLAGQAYSSQSAASKASKSLPPTPVGCQLIEEWAECVIQEKECQRWESATNENVAGYAIAGQRNAQLPPQPSPIARECLSWRTVESTATCKVYNEVCPGSSSTAGTTGSAR